MGDTLGAINRQQLRALLALRRDYRWRNGLLQGAVSFGVINQDEWKALRLQVAYGELRPSAGRMNRP